jgi:large subunit ribosomal protein L24e
MPKCAFSGEEIKPGTGIMYVYADGRIIYFKDSKAKKNLLKLGRNPRTTTWTKAYQAEKKKSLQSAASKAAKGDQ